MCELKGKKAIVTGASRGIGKTIASQLASQGVDLICCSTNQDTSDKVALELQDQYGVSVYGYGMDVKDFDETKAFMAFALDKLGAIDILVNNAGITRDNLLLRMSVEEWTSVLEVNLTSVFNLTKAVLRPMLKQRSGRIINISSVVGEMGNPGQSNYAASKAGIIGFSKSIAKEVGAKGITCNVVAPGFIETDMIGSLPEDYLNNIIGSIPTKRLGKPEDIAHLVSFLSAEESSYITGQVINVDGGMLM